MKKANNLEKESIFPLQGIPLNFDRGCSSMVTPTLPLSMLY